MSSRTIVLSTPEIREMLAALDALGGPEALEATGALLEARRKAKVEVRLELTRARRRALDTALARREARLEAEREDRLRTGDPTAAAIYDRFARTVAGARKRLGDCPLTAIA